MRTFVAGAAWLLALAGSALVTSCGSDDPVSPGLEPTRTESLEQNGFRLTYTAPLVVGHTDTITVARTAAVEAGAAALVTAVNPATAGVYEPCSVGANGSNPACAFAMCYNALSSAGNGSCTVLISSVLPGDAQVRVQVGSRSAVFSLPIEAQKATAIKASAERLVLQPIQPSVVTATVVDQRGQPMQHALPSAVTNDASIAAVTLIAQYTVTDVFQGTTTGAGSATITIMPKKPGTTTLHLQYQSAALDLPITITSLGDDSAVVFSSGTLVNVVANDYAGTNSFGPQIVRPPQHGTASIVSGEVRFDPTPGFIGLDSLRYIGAGNARNDTATIRLTIMPGPFPATVLPAGLTPVDLSEVGQVAGTLALTGGSRRGFRWSSNGVVDTLSYDTSEVRIAGIDPAGNVIGSAGGRVLRWRPGVAAPDDIFGAGNPACTLGLAVSSGGTIIASCSTYAKRVRQGVIDSIGFVNDLWTFVNDRGDYAGFEITSYSPALFHRAEGQPSWAWLFAGRYASPAGLNNRGDVTVNGEWHQGLNDSRAALVTADSSVDLSAKYPWLGRVSGINDDQWIVGTKTGDPADVFLLIDGTAARVRQLISGSESLSNVVSVLALTNSRRMLVRAKDGQYAVLAPPN